MSALSARAAALVLLLSTLCWLLPNVGFAGQAIVFLSLAQEEEAADLEQDFRTALILSLDNREVVPEALGPEAFAGLSTADQVARIRAMVDRRGALAAVWLDLDNPALLRAQLVFAGRARAVVRLLEVPRGTGAMQELALSAKEIISTTQLELSLPPAVDVTPPTVEPPEEEATAGPPTEETPAISTSTSGAQPAWTLSLGTAALVTPLPSPALGTRLEGQAAVGVRLPMGLAFRLGGRAGSTMPDTDGERTTQAALLAEVSYAGELGILQIGPAIGVAVGGMWYRKTGADTDASTTMLDVRFSPGVRSSLALPLGPRLEASIGVNLMPLRHDVRDRFDGETLLATSHLEVFIFLGLGIPIPPTGPQFSNQVRKDVAADGIEEVMEGAE